MKLVMYGTEKYQVAAFAVNQWVSKYKNLFNPETPFTMLEYRALKQKYERILHLFEIIKLTGFLDKRGIRRKSCVLF